jgi:hypothetical protein
MKKGLCIGISLLLMLSAFTACGSNANNNASPATTEPTQADSAPTEQAQPDPATTEEATVEPANEIDYSSHVEFTYWTPATANEIESDYSKYAVVQFMNNKFNMTLRFQQPVAGTEADSLNLMLGTGEYTDIIDSSYYTGSIDQLNIDGIIINIADYLSYMPNFNALLEGDEVFRKHVYNDSGQILNLPVYITEDPLHWGGLVYRRDILETMTGGNVQFPSGNEEPTTIEDFEYMLPLMQQYFEASGMPEFASLIIPASGYFVTSDLITTFGAAGSYYMDGDTVKFGPIEEGFYKYLTKMQEWYAKGYIYKDFATRINDMFYLPNTSLTYGGAAGIWFGMNGQLGSLMSMPEYGLNVEVRPLANPIDPANGVTSTPNMMYRGHNNQTGGVMISTSCQHIERLLSVIDYMYSEEGALLKEYGITKEQGAADYELYREYGFENGTYTLDSNGDVVMDEKLSGDSGLSRDPFVDYKMPGMRNNIYTNRDLPDVQKDSTATWLKYGYAVFPPVYRTSDEEDVYSSNQTAINDYINTSVLKFILGDQVLDDASWNEYVNQIKTYGIDENIAIQQAAYDRYKVR